MMRSSACVGFAASSFNRAASSVRGTSAGGVLNQAFEVSWSSVYTAWRAPMREFPRRRCRPNQGASRPLAMVSSHKVISANSTAVALRSTP